ncbi:hypothetical protein LUZ61_016661 [Rhynchospora tenuis]|uniref:F-box domain-containing protein n=1 Tax=Rhynchospora tenuis TaxID=198213 RepID=A0AAD6EK89_9POAL|nr:hypothetical protein LUZ61_016661 [Rhynchospora tenuis]
MASLPNPKRRRLSSTSDATSASLDRLLRSVLAMADPSVAIGLSLECLLDSTPLHSDKESLLDGARKIASSLLEASTRFAQKLAIAHNSSVWPLPAELTTKVFSLLDTESLCFAAATCLHFRKCASDPLCYANIDLTRSPAKVTNLVVSTMIQRAGNNLQSIKLGSFSMDENNLDKSPLTSSCLAALQLDGGASGLLLRKLHLHNFKMRRYNPCSALSACKSLSELEIVGIQFWFTRIWRTICEHCHLIERLCLDVAAFCMPLVLFDYPHDNNKRVLRSFQVKDLLKGCPLLSTLTLRGFHIWDKLSSVLVKGARGLKYLDLSHSSGFSGFFLRDLGNGGSNNSLDTLIIRDCIDLEAEEVSRFLSAVRCGEWKSLRYMDISSKMGLLVLQSSGLRCAIEVSQVLQERPDIHLVADYPPEICLYGDRYKDLYSSNSDSDTASSDSDSGYSDIDSGSPSSSSSLPDSISKISFFSDDEDFF